MAPPQRRGGFAAFRSARCILGGLVLIILAAQVLVWSVFHRPPATSADHDDTLAVVHDRRHGLLVLDRPRRDLVPTTTTTTTTTTTALKSIPFKRRGTGAAKLHEKRRPWLPSGKASSPSKEMPPGDGGGDGAPDTATNVTVEALPEWIRNYLRWHHRMRMEFPGELLYRDPSAPPLLIRTCLGICGGLNDRLGQLPWDLYLANQTQRVLLIHWHRPVPLRHFLMPNLVDWTADTSGVPGFGPPMKEARTYTRDEMKMARSVPDLFEGYASDRPQNDFWDRHLDEAMWRATIGDFRRHRVLRFHLLGHVAEDQLEKRLRDWGETDTLHWTSSFGILFRAFFRPSDAVQIELDDLYRTLGMSPGTYTAVHCRVRHPKAHPPHVVVLGKDPAYNADKSGLPWTGATRNFAIATATQALLCAETLLTNHDEPMYFMSDSADLARYMTVDLSNNASAVASTSAVGEDPAVEAMALEVVRRHRVVSSPASTSRDVAHIDKNKGRDPREYLSTFVDFYAAVNARCVAFGVGYYALLAAKVSGTPCRLLYGQEQWGRSAGNKTSRAQACSINRALA